MTVSVDSLRKFLERNNFVANGSQESVDAALELMELIRAESRPASDKGRKTFNVIDTLKELTVEQVNERLDLSRSGLVSVFLNVLGDFNLSSAIRSANWYNQDSVWIVGRKRWDRRGAVGSHNYIPINYARTFDEAFSSLRERGYTIVAAEIADNAVSLADYQWDEKTAVVYGEEGAGLSEEVLGLVDSVVYIPGRGSVRSLNVAATASTFSYDYHAKRGYMSE